MCLFKHTGNGLVTVLAINQGFGTVLGKKNGTPQPLLDCENKLWSEQDNSNKNMRCT